MNLSVPGGISKLQSLGALLSLQNLTEKTNTLTIRKAKKCLTTDRKSRNYFVCSYYYENIPLEHWRNMHWM